MVDKRVLAREMQVKMRNAGGGVFELARLYVHALHATRSVLSWPKEASFHKYTLMEVWLLLSFVHAIFDWAYCRTR